MSATDLDGGALRIGGHQWVEANDLVKWPHCAVCGIIRRHDDKNNPCKGAAKLALREYYTDGIARCLREAAAALSAQQPVAWKGEPTPPMLTIVPHLRPRPDHVGVEDMVVLARDYFALSAWTRVLLQAVFDPENQPSQFGTQLLSASPPPAQQEGK